MNVETKQTNLSTSEIILYKHKCGICERRWDSDKKVDTCFRCGQQHISMSSYIEQKMQDEK